ncbi:MAG: hypothetical protein FWG14_03795 [Peptococcaceae bacterium]|nr:hypothetical protein [Peptococcaceae bacterium]
MLTEERASILTEILSADEARAQTLLSLDTKEALKQINALGNDFTLDELKEYGKAMEASSAQGELDADSLDDVAGGIFRPVPFPNPSWNYWKQKLPNIRPWK